MPWTVVTKPEGNNPGVVKRALSSLAGRSAEDVNENMGGIIIFVSDGSREHEVSRVAYIRRASRNPDVSFQTQLKHEVQKARAAVATLNGLFDEAGDLQ